MALERLHTQDQDLNRYQDLVRRFGNDIESRVKALEQKRFITIPGSRIIPTNVDVVKADTTAGNVELILPRTRDFPFRFMYIVRTTAGANTLTVAPAENETIDGSTSAVSLPNQYDKMMLVTDGVEWFQFV